jgi:hypothetical protein
MNYGPISPKIPGLLHGADYNPDQWLHDERVLSEDVRLMKLSRCSVMSVNIFGWAACEPEEGQYTFEWLDRTINTLYENGIYTILATPSGARPAWMSHRYPEVLRVGSDGRRNLHSGRQQPLPHIACIPGKGARHERAAGAALRQPPRADIVACVQRIRRRVLLPAVPGGLPAVPQAALRHAGQAEPCLVDRVLEPYLHRLAAGGGAHAPR